MLQQVVRSGAPQSTTGLVYFIAPDGEQDPIKIGFTQDLGRRLLAYIGHSPQPLSLIALVEAPREVEQSLHGLFRADRLHGEWFRSSQELLSIVDAYRYRPGAPVERITEDGELWICRGRHIAAETTVGSRSSRTSVDQTVLPWMHR